MSRPQQLPTGWDDSRVRDVIAHYDAQTEDDQADEIEAALAAEGVTLMAVPAELADQVRALVSRHKATEPGTAPAPGPERSGQPS